MFKIIPETTQDFANRITCFNIPGSSDSPITAQSLLPNASLYTVKLLSRELPRFFKIKTFTCSMLKIQRMRALTLPSTCRASVKRGETTTTPFLSGRTTGTQWSSILSATTACLAPIMTSTRYCTTPSHRTSTQRSSI